MKKTIALFLLAAFLLGGCAAVTEKDNSGTKTTFTDDLGRQISVCAPRRIAVLLGSYAQICCLADAYVCAAPDDAWEDLGLELPEDAVNLGSTENLSMELLLSSKPDLVLASTNRRQNLEWQAMFESTGIPVAYYSVDDFDDYLRILELLTGFNGRQDLYERYGTQVRKQIDAVIEKSQKRLEERTPPTVLFMTASATKVRAQNSEGTVLGAMLKTLGCVNAADSEKMLLEDLSIEYILLTDPDYIFFVQRGDDAQGTQEHIRSFLTENPAWSKLTAVKNNRVFFMEKTLFNLKPNHRWGEAYEILEEILENG